jgi:hypothetical protein
MSQVPLLTFLGSLTEVAPKGLEFYLGMGLDDEVALETPDPEF